MILNEEPFGSCLRAVIAGSSMGTEFTTHTIVMDEVLKYSDQRSFRHQAVKHLFSAVKLDILTWESMVIDSLLGSA